MKKFKPQIPCHRKQPPSPPSLATKSYNSQINRHSTAGAHRNVINLYFTMLKSNILPDPYTYPSMLKACISLNLFSLGLSFHQHAVVHGCSLDSYIGASLINFYAKFGFNEIAHKVFDVMPERNVVPWTAIIGCYIRSGYVDPAFRLYKQMHYEEVKPSSVTLLTILSGISDDGSTFVQSFHGCAIRYGFGCDLALMNCILSSYGKCGRVIDARNLFESMDGRDIVTWNSLVSSYALIDDIREISILLYKMCLSGLYPDKQTFGSLISAATRLGNSCIGKVFHGKAVSSGIVVDVHFKTLLISMYLKFKDLTTAYQIFEGICDKDMILWTAMISGLLQSDCPDKALDLFHKMLVSKVKPSTTTIACALAACAHMGSFLVGTSIHGYLLRQKISVDIPTQNSLITMYAKCGQLTQSCAVFETMNKRDVVTWNAMVAAHAQNGQLSNALYIFSEMRKSLDRPDSVTVVSLLQACASFGAHHQGKCIHNFVIRNSFKSSLLIDTALVDMYFKCGNIDSGRRCFDRMSNHDVVSWSTVIGGYGSHGQGENALKMHVEFLQSGIEPNHVTFLSILYACSHNGLVNEGIRLFETMTNHYKIKPKLEHCACMVDLLCRAGRLEDAYDFYKTIFSEPVVDVLGILLDACRTKGNKELGDIIACEIRNLNPEDAGNMVQMVHLYASSARWDDVGEAWVQMRSLGLKKIPAWSFIELNGNITTFFKDHSSHPEYNDIAICLKSIFTHLKPKKPATDSLERYDHCT